MTEQAQFFSPNHNRLLNIAVWAKYLAWVVLVVFILNAGLQIFQYQVLFSNTGQPQFDVWSFLIKNDPLRAFEMVVNMVATALRGVIYYLILKGISLGLNMIVETDINYREREQAEGAQ